MANIVLSARERTELSCICNTRHNWTDGGHWAGRGKQPACYTPIVERNSATVTLKFPTDDTAIHWNTRCDKNARIMGHGVTIGVNLILAEAPILLPIKISTLMCTMWSSFIAGTTISLIQSEKLASLGTPEVGRGWRAVFEVNHELNWRPMMGTTNYFKQTIKVKTFDSAGKQRFEASSERKVRLEDIPMELAVKLTRKASITRELDYVWER